MDDKDVLVALGNLLAVIHGDGGHHQSAVGTVQACKDAESVVARFRLERDSARAYACHVSGCEMRLSGLAKFLEEVKP